MLRLTRTYREPSKVIFGDFYRPFTSLELLVELFPSSEHYQVFKRVDGSLDFTVQFTVRQDQMRPSQRFREIASETVNSNYLSLLHSLYGL